MEDKPRQPAIDAAAVVDAAVAAAIDAVPVDAAPAKPQPVDLASLPVWPIPPGTRDATPRAAVYASDAPPDWLLHEFLPRQNYLGLPLTKRLTGRVEGSRADVAAAIAAQLGVDLTPPKFRTSDQPTVDLDFSGATVRDLLRVLADTGRVNIVAPGELGEVTLRIKRVAWDAALDGIASLIKRSVVKVGNTIYVLPAGAKLPELPKVATTEVTLDVKDASAAHATAALRKLIPVPVDHCGGAKLSVRVKRVSAAEALRAIEVIGGHALDAAPCPSKELAGAPLDDDRLVAIAQVGTKRAATLDRKGQPHVATVGLHISDIGSEYVTIDGTRSLTLHGNAMFGWREDWYLHLRRTTAIGHVDGKWRAWTVSEDGRDHFLDPYAPGNPRDVTFVVDEKGLQIGDPKRGITVLPLAK